jgi:hypothetical protein
LLSASTVANFSFFLIRLLLHLRKIQITLRPGVYCQIPAARHWCSTFVSTAIFFTSCGLSRALTYAAAKDQNATGTRGGDWITKSRASLRGIEPPSG